MCVRVCTYACVCVYVWSLRDSRPVSYESKKKEVTVPSASLVPSSAEKVVSEDRQFHIEAQIVRIMKARKELRFGELQAEASARHASAGRSGWHFVC